MFVHAPAIGQEMLATIVTPAGEAQDAMTLPAVKAVAMVPVSVQIVVHVIVTGQDLFAIRVVPAGAVRIA